MWKDTLWHVILIAGLALAFELLTAILGLSWGPLVAAILVHLLREATQQEIKHFNGRFGRGWWPFDADHPYGPDKLRETYVPVAAWLVLGASVSLLAG